MSQQSRFRGVFALLIGGAAAALLAARAVAADPEINFGGADLHPAAPTDGATPDAPAMPPPAAPAGGPAARLHPYVGLQAGGSGASLDPLVHANPGGLPTTTDPDRHYRAQAGLDYAVTPKVDLGFDYRYSNTDHPALVLAPAPDTELESQQRDQAARFSLRYKFGPGN